MSYSPSRPPVNPALLPEWLAQEMAILQRALEAAQASVILQTLYAAPDRLYEGMIVKADGTTWNPGSGAGIYAYVGAAWVKL